jgi:nucleotide sugar dehydrogenase
MKFKPGPGVGGHCIPCDPHYLLWQLRRQRAEAPLIDTAMKAIAARPGRVVRRIKDTLADRGMALRGARVLVVGVAYKPGVADVRESPALEIIEELHGLGARVGYHDALVPSVNFDGWTMRAVPEIDAEQWDAVLLHTLHPQTGLDGVLGRVAVVDATYSLAATS